MSEALRKTVSNDSLGTPKKFTLYEQNGIKITLTLPSPVALNLNSQEFYPPEADRTTILAPVLENNSGMAVKSASFSIKLNNVIENDNTVANVRWWSVDEAQGLQSMEFTCGQIDDKGNGSGTAKTPGYSRIRWATMANTARQNQTFTVSNVNVLLTFNSSADTTTGANDGPIIRVG
ncbi:hypothetical protein [Pseudomonas xantholysinigenes]|uniref:Uncharacterized protein n=1 Tax=Pseudomonas xantholysinigenes TaxID=2745490 RepID=A0A9E6PTD9_9PSED|nr:hypothetical protein [Pseudomonas xantholysinigenes]QXI36748.1 hypothetical protein HU772_015455 [Pseudomonas xantholysinigenes]